MAYSTHKTMGQLETGAKEQRQKDFIQKAVLATIATAGILLVTAVAPNTLQLLGGLSRDKRRFRYQTNSVIGRLAAKGYVRFVQDGRGKKRVEITPEGRRTLELQIQMAQLKSQNQKRWDKRWRMVMFDIPEHRKKDREHLRHTMIEAGFTWFQNSVWIFPYDCEDLISLLKVDMRLGNAVRYAIVEKLENDTEIRRHFKLA